MTSKQPGMRPTLVMIISSYSCLLTAVDRITKALDKGQETILLCTSTQIYRFLHPLSSNADIRLEYVDISLIHMIGLRSPWSIWRLHRDVRKRWSQWFRDIPNGSEVHFFNRLYALHIGYWVWRLKTRCFIYYAECDPVDIFENVHGVISLLKWFVLFIIYPIPFEMLRGSGEDRIVGAMPFLSSKFIDLAVDYEYPMVRDNEFLRSKSIYKLLARDSKAEVLWITQPLVESGLVQSDQYLSILQNCASITYEFFPPDSQAVKYHPRTSSREGVWDPSVEIIPNCVPAEFLKMPDLKVIITVSSTAMAALGIAHNVKIISLVNIVPFTDEDTYTAHFKLAKRFIHSVECKFPSSLDEFRFALRDNA